MKKIEAFGLGMALFALTIQPAFAGSAAVPVPEIDGGGAILAIGLVAGLVALLRERFFRK